VKDLVELTADGLYCEAGDFYVDPWGPVDRAVITHAHSDHARWGSKTYVTAAPGAEVLRARLGHDAAIEGLPYGEAVARNGVRVSLHPAGHVLGSSQVRIESQGQVWVISGDYKLERDPTCTAFEPQRCHTFVSESTFGLPIYRWPANRETIAAVNAWWRANQEAGKASVLFGYALGKLQRVLANVDASIGPIFCHGAVEKLNRIYRRSGVDLPATQYAGDVARATDWTRALILAPPSCNASPWMRKFGTVSTAFASGWMRIRGTRRRRSIDRGFVISDHADWPALLSAINTTEAECIWVTHGYRAQLAHWLEEHGKRAKMVETRFEGERDDTGEEIAAEEANGAESIL
jgi:putative mRNA 3-end processing factor